MSTAPQFEPQPEHDPSSSGTPEPRKHSFAEGEQTQELSAHEDITPGDELDLSELRSPDRPSHLPAQKTDVGNTIEAITRLARDAGLEFPDVEFLFVTVEQMNIAASQDGFPVRYPHWKFGMEAERMDQMHRRGAGKIFELVLNTEPCVAYLVETNTLFENTLVIAHVLGHADFFKNNNYFRPTRKDMYVAMEQHARFIEECAEKYGEAEVEFFIDNVLAATNLYNPLRAHISEPRGPIQREHRDSAIQFEADEHMDAFVNPASELERHRQLDQEREESVEFLIGEVIPSRDILRYIIDYSDSMEDWQKTITEMLLDEAEYFGPQMLTKVINEGWATFWHHKLLEDNGLIQDKEIIEWADLNAGVLAMPKGSFNPYTIGYKLFKYIERTQGLEECFEARTRHNDASFVATYLTQDFCEEEKLFAYKYNEWRRRHEIDTRDFEGIREQLINQLTNYGTPRIYARAINHLNNGTLLLEHQVDETEPPELDMQWAPATLRCLAHLWGRDVHLRYQTDRGEEKTMKCTVTRESATETTYEISVDSGHD